MSDNFGHGNLQVRDGLPAYNNRANEIIREADELMLQIEMLVFPIDQLRINNMFPNAAVVTRGAVHSLSKINAKDDVKRFTLITNNSTA